ncbi:MAG: UDP-N-acetyl-D-mannosamine dehydrogenase [Anaerolineaceae bacterium]|nr:UDP-N-acetyl-D-mannosamine dehydrogenase [Anaerolineaceae bacterium]
MNLEKICVLGLGYIGLPTASTFASHAVKVIGVDVNPHVVQSLQNGILHIYEPGLRTIVQAAVQSGNLVIKPQPEAADAFIIAVPTPFKDSKKADLAYVEAATESIVPFLRPGNLVILESTSPPLTTINVVAPILEKSGLKAGVDFKLAYSPERVLPGQILRELIENARVIGGINQESAEAGRDLYRIFVRGDIILTDATTAEMVKLMENTTRDVNIALANEFSRLADRFGVDVWEAIQIANLHPRINILSPGPGVGGHCISVDPWFLVEAAPDITPLILSARQVNDEQPTFVVDLLKRVLGKPLAESSIAILGLAYKPNVDDMRESPAVEITQHLIKAGAQVKAHDPFLPGKEIQGIQTTNTIEEAIQNVDVLVLLVAHQQLKDLTAEKIKAANANVIVLDTVNAWTIESFNDTGIKLYKLGVGK